MKLSKVVIVACAVALCTGVSPAAAGAKRPSLTGEWVSDAARSSFGDYSGPLSKARTRLDIRHEGPEVRTVWDFEYGPHRLSQFSLVFTDGRGETNSSLLDADDLLSLPAGYNGGGPGREVKSKTVWEGDRLVTRTGDRLKLSGEFVEVEVSDVWELSADRKTLKQTTEVTPKREGRGGARKFVRVYNRAE